MKTVRFTLAAALLASAAATAADSSVVLQDEANKDASCPLGLLEEVVPANGKPVPAFDLPLVVRDEEGNVVLDVRNKGPLPLARLASASQESGDGEAWLSLMDKP